jgi:hypothetical protein
VPGKQPPTGVWENRGRVTQDKKASHLRAVAAKQNKLRDFSSASELYRLSDSGCSAKLVAPFAGRGVLRGQRDGSLWPLLSVF